MTELIVCLSSGKGSWNYIARLIKEESWDNVFLITNDFGKENFKADNAQFIVVDFKKPAVELIKDIQQQLKGKIKAIEVAINLISGNGKEHMVIISALLKLGLAIRLVVVGESGVTEI
ncbi:hypothetical protein ISS05_01335 [Candidatus Woesearchaeota archaeon]|nr:hypothetical protein [Candidatus Woesearchaeota archaeon]